MNRKISGKGAFAVSAALASVFVLQMFSDLPVSVSAASVLSTSEITENMGVGWNLGNSLDSINQGFSSDNIYDYETQWSNPVVTKSLIDKVKAKGFNTVRIPVTWYQHISTDSNYTIDPAWMNRVKEVVDYAYNDGMYVIINVHHEPWINRADFESAEASMKSQLCAVWKQIAAAFADYDQHLIFEGMNEPREVGGSANEWVGNENCYKIVNNLNAAFVETVRSVESPYRQTRMLMVPDYAASRENYIYSYLTIPKASGSIDADNDGDDDYVAVSLHAYSPYNFAMGDGDHSTFSTSYETELEGMFSAMQAEFLQEGVPIVLGEFSASNYGYDAARLKWAEAYMRNASEYGIPCVLWDNNVESNNGGEAHGYINRSTGEWYSSGGKVADMLISTRKNTEWGTKTHITYPMYTHNDYSSGSNVNIAGDGNMKVSELSGFCSGKELAVKYTGTLLPVFALMNSSWGGWTTLTPYDFDKDNGIAYFSYDQIMKTWNSSNGDLCYIKLNNKDDIGFSGVTLLDIPKQKTEFKITKNPSSQTVYPSQQITLSAAASAENASHSWLISHDYGATWSTAYTASENVSSTSSTTNVTAVFDLSKNNINALDTVLFRCDFSNGKTTISTSSAEVTVITGKPVISSITIGSGQVSLKWIAVENASKYKVFYRKNGTSSWSYNETTATSYTVTGLTNDTKYDLLVLSSNGSAWSSWTNSDIIYATPSAPPAPALPTVKAAAGDSKVTLSWNSVSGAVKYRVFYRLNGTSAWTYKTTTSASYTVSGLTNGKKYDFLVLAGSTNAWSKYTNSNIINATPVSSAPALPTVKAAAGDSKVTLSWNAVTGAVKYRVFYRVNGTSSWTSKDTTATSYTVSGLTNGKKYDFLVLAGSTNAWSKYTNSNIINATPVSSAPALPTVKAAAGDSKVTLSWNAVTGAVKYRVFYRLNGTSAWTSKDTTATSYTVSGLTNGKKYDFLVLAGSTNAWSKWTNSNMIYATPVASSVVPALPTVKAAPGNAQTVLSWNSVSGAVKYRVFYRLNGTSAWTSKDTTATSYTVTGLTNGKKYDFLVLAGSTNAWSKWTNSNIINATPLAAPALPTVKATAGNASVALSWNAVTGASKYRVFYRLNGTSAWTSKDTTSTGYTITGLTNGKKYDILVLAGSTNAWSKYTSSNIVNVTPKA